MRHPTRPPPAEGSLAISTKPEAVVRRACITPSSDTPGGAPPYWEKVLISSSPPKTDW